MIDKKIVTLFTIILWFLQALLAIVFLTFGFFKLTRPIEELSYYLPWITDVPAIMVRCIGILESVFGLGMILPYFFKQISRFKFVAPLGIIILLCGAIYLHIQRGETMIIQVNVFLILAAAIVFTGRYYLSKHTQLV